jgi:hypothetical protein
MATNPFQSKFTPKSLTFMSTSKSMTPYSKVIEELESKGYGDGITIGKHGAHFGESEKQYSAEELTIVRVYRFEGESNPADESVIFAIEAEDKSQGYIINAYGTYSDEDNAYYDDFIRGVKMDQLRGL